MTTKTYTIIETTKPRRKRQSLDFNGGRWVTGQIGRYSYEAKIYTGGSEFGIHEGNISKLSICNTATGKDVASYDRGWDLLPFSERIVRMVDALVEFYADK